MTWEGPRDAIEMLENGSVIGRMSGTSSTTLLLTTGRVGWLRMYLAKGVSLANDVASTIATGEERWREELSDVRLCSTYAYTEQWTQLFLPYFDSAPLELTPYTSLTVPDGALSLDISIEIDDDSTNDASEDDAEQLLTATCIPGFKKAERWPYVRRDYRNYFLGRTCTVSERVRIRDFLVTYKDPTVVAVPGQGNGFLMLMVRVRVLKSDAEDNLSDGEELDPINAVMSVNGDANDPDTADLKLPGRCLADIVAWWAPDPTFSTDLKGPFLMVDTLDALDFRHRRAWLGVPGAVFTRVGGESWLYLYYVVERHDGELSTAQGLGEPACAETVAYTELEVTIPSSDWTGTFPGVEMETRERLVSPVYPFERGIALRRFKLSDILGEIVDITPDDVVPENCWRTDEVAEGCPPWSGPVTGQNMGRVRFWMARAGEPGVVSAFEDHFLDRERGTFPYVADPAPALCQDTLALFVAAITSRDEPMTPTSGHGIWRAAGIPSGERVEVLDADGAPLGSHLCVYGRDFVVSSRTDERGTLSRDRLIASTSGQMFVDPDPVQLPDGSWRVFFGQVGPLEALQRIDGAPEDGCRSWEDAWGIAAPITPGDVWRTLGVPCGAEAPPIDWSAAARAIRNAGSLVAGAPDG